MVTPKGKRIDPTKVNGGKRPGAGRPPGTYGGEVLTPEILTNPFSEVVVNYKSGKEFLLDVLNLRFHKLGVTKINSADRMKAAIELMPYTDKKMPVDVNVKDSTGYAAHVRAAEKRTADPQPIYGEGDTVDVTPAGTVH